MSFNIAKTLTDTTAEFEHCDEEDAEGQHLCLPKPQIVWVCIAGCTCKKFGRLRITVCRSLRNSDNLSSSGRGCCSGSQVQLEGAAIVAAMQTQALIALGKGRAQVSVLRTQARYSHGSNNRAWKGEGILRLPLA